MAFSKLIPFSYLVLVFCTADAIGQPSGYAGAEVQAYPAGIIIGARGGLNVNSQHELNLKVGYNITDRRDFGKHDNEEGGGTGFGLGYRYYFQNQLGGFFMGARSDLWFMEIDWEDQNPIQEGKTEIVVLQPTAEVGYDILRSNTDWLLAPTVSFGVEINIDTKGKSVGEGAILLGGLNASYGF